MYPFTAIIEVLGAVYISIVIFVVVGVLKPFLDRHIAVARAIKKRDPKAAADAMALHFDDAVGDLLKAEASNGAA